ncbi:MAG: hypothetical protein ACRCXH_07435 [Shewanella sp.]
MMIGLNFAICFVGAFVCICRLGVMSNNTKPAIGNVYVIWMMAFVLSSLSFVFQPINIMQIVLGTIAAGHHLSGYKAWRGGAPAYALKPSWEHFERRFVKGE